LAGHVTSQAVDYFEWITTVLPHGALVF